MDIANLACITPQCYAPVGGKFYYLYLAVDVWSRMIVGWSVHEDKSARLVNNKVREGNQWFNKWNI